MADTIVTQRGQTLDLQFRWYQGEVGSAAVDLTGAVVSVRETNRPVLQAATISIVDAPGGIVRMTTTEEQSDQLSIGPRNWFRLEAQWPDGSNRVTPKIAIEVQ